MHREREREEKKCAREKCKRGKTKRELHPERDGMCGKMLREVCRENPETQQCVQSAVVLQREEERTALLEARDFI